MGYIPHVQPSVRPPDSLWPAGKVGGTGVSPEMASSNADRRAWESTPLWYSLARSLVTPHWLFTLVVVSTALWGVALAPVTDWYRTGVLVVALALGMEGMHDLDLADPSVAVTIDPRVQRGTGYALIAAGVLVGVYAASLTTWTFLAFVALETVAGVAYNGEWFDGLFHDVDRLGWATAGLSLGLVPLLVGYFLLAETISAVAVLWGVVAALYAVGILHLYQVVKVPVLYDLVGVRHVRTREIEGARADRMVATGLLCVIVGVILTGVAFALTSASA